AVKEEGPLEGEEGEGLTSREEEQEAVPVSILLHIRQERPYLRQMNRHHSILGTLKTETPGLSL
uniref:Uncharacterized protein n=1 Tax=Amphimedon queenslandica TaxID=400682 RepID=A0A1X7U443_AMPQE